MSSSTRIILKSGGVSDPLNELWQVDGSERGTRDPEIPTMPLDDPRPFYNSCCALVASLVPLAVGAMLVAPNVAIKTAAPAPFVVPPHIAPYFKPSLHAGDTSRASWPIIQAQGDAQLRGALRVRVDRPREITDTSQPQPLALRPVAAAPLYRNPTDNAPRLVWQPLDGSRAAWNVFHADASTDVTRGALRVRTDRPYHLADTSRPSPAPLLVQVAAAPFVPVQFVAPADYAWQPADTTRSSAKTLSSDAQLPFSIAPRSAPWLTRSSADTSQDTPITLLVVALPPGAATWAPAVRYRHQTSDSTTDTPKTLIADAQAPVFVVAQPVPPRLWFQPADGTSDTPKTLTADAQAPVFVAPYFGRVQHRATESPNPDESAGTPKPLVADAQLPFAVEQRSAPMRAPYVVTDTSQRVYVGLLVVQLPPGAASWLPLSLRPAIGTDASRGTPKALIADAQAPFAILAQSQAPRQWYAPTDSTRGSAKGLIPDAQLPFFVASSSAPAGSRDPLAGTHSYQSLTLAFVAAPISNAPSFAPSRYQWQPASTAAGTGKPLIADAQLPFAVLQHTAPDRLRPVVDTSRGIPFTLRPVVIALPPGAAVSVNPPSLSWQAQTQAGTPFTLTAQAPFVTQLHARAENRHGVSDTSRGTPTSLLPTPLPPGTAAAVGLARSSWQPADTSQPAWADRLTIPLPPGQSVQLSPLMPWWQAVTTHSPHPPRAAVFLDPSETRTRYVPADLRTFAVASDGRVYTVETEVRSRVIASDGRVYTIASESRERVIPTDDRTRDIDV